MKNRASEQLVHHIVGEAFLQTVGKELQFLVSLDILHFWLLSTIRLTLALACNLLRLKVGEKNLRHVDAHHGDEETFLNAVYPSVDAVTDSNLVLIDASVRRYRGVLNQPFALREIRAIYQSYHAHFLLDFFVVFFSSAGASFTSAAGATFVSMAGTEGTPTVTLKPSFLKRRRCSRAKRSRAMPLPVITRTFFMATQLLSRSRSPCECNT